MSEVVGVHGMAQQQRGRSQLIAVWEPAFRDGVEIAGGGDAAAPSFGLAFYGDLFLSAAAQGDAATQKFGYGGRQEGAAKGATILHGEDGAAGLESVSADELAFLDEATDEAIAQRPDLGEPMGFGPLPGPLQPLARRLTRRFDGVLVLMFVSALRQVKLYLEDDELAGHIRGIVSDAIGSDTTVLLAHSLGTVVAFDTLTLNPQLQLDTLITVGSPLGMKAVASRLRPSAAGRQGLAGFPPNLRRWVNIYDPGDPVAAAGAVSRLWPAAVDYTVDNEDTPHAIERYLGKRVTGRAVLDGVSR
jgi:hypothetical protein